MKTLVLFFSLLVAMPVAVVAFYLKSFAVLTGICVYVTAVSVVLFIAALRGPGRSAEEAHDLGA